MLIEEQISARQQRARSAIQSILAEPVGQGYGDYDVRPASGGKYRVPGMSGIQGRCRSGRTPGLRVRAEVPVTLANP